METEAETETEKETKENQSSNSTRGNVRYTLEIQAWKIVLPAGPDGARLLYVLSLGNDAFRGALFV
jgi:hypothetical protein